VTFTGPITVHRPPLPAATFDDLDTARTWAAFQRDRHGRDCYLIDANGTPCGSYEVIPQQLTSRDDPWHRMPERQPYSGGAA
jgi:hypothetical protein